MLFKSIYRGFRFFEQGFGSRLWVAIIRRMITDTVQLTTPTVVLPQLGLDPIPNNLKP